MVKCAIQEELLKNWEKYKSMNIINNKEKRICGIITLLILIVCGVIFMNSLYLDGYNSTLYNVDSGIITDVVGYNQNANSFSVKDSGDTYIKLINTDITVKEIVMSFDSVPNNDVYINVNYNRNAEDRIIKWKKGSRYFIIPMGIENEGITIKIPCDFVLDNICYANKNNAQVNVKKIIFIVIVIIIALWFMLMHSKQYSLLYNRMLNRIKSAIDFRGNKEKNKIIFRICCITSGTWIFSMIATKLISLAGRCEFNWKTVFLMICIFSIADILVFARKLIKNKIEIVAFLVVLIVGIMFVVLEPVTPGVSWDDETHYSRAVNISHEFDKKISLSDQIVLNKFASVALNKAFYAKKEQKAYIEYLNMLEDSKYYIDATGGNIGIGSVSYIPSALFMMFARGIGLKFSFVYIFGKFANTFLLAVLVYCSMKKLKDGKIVVLLVALIPTNMYLAANYSYDTWLTGWAMLGLSTFFGELQQKEKEIDLKTVFLIYISMFLAILPKMVYFPLLFICFFMPMSKFKCKSNYWIYKFGIILLCILPFIIVYMQNIAVKSDVADTRGGSEVSSTSQLEFIKGDIKGFLGILLNFLKTYLNPFVEGKEYITQLAYNGYIPFEKSLVAVIIAGACISRNEKSGRTFPWWFKIGTLAVYAGIGAIAAISMYVMFTPVGSQVINGCQGRYIIAVIFPVLYVLSRFGGKTVIKNCFGEVNINSVLVAILTMESIYGIWLGCVSLY